MMINIYIRLQENIFLASIGIDMSDSYDEEICSRKPIAFQAFYFDV
jgi:hypothetical protein